MAVIFKNLHAKIPQRRLLKQVFKATFRTEKASFLQTYFGVLPRSKLRGYYEFFHLTGLVFNELTAQFTWCNCVL